MKPLVKQIQQLIDKALASGEATREQIQELNDGIHSFADLYDSRAHYNALAFALLDQMGVNVCKSNFHNDGTKVPHRFVVGYWPNEEWPESIKASVRQFTQHYPIEQWELFKIPTAPRMPFPFDGHTSSDTLERIKAMIFHADWIAHPED